MKIRIFTIILLLFTVLSVSAQKEYFYYYNDSKVLINLDVKSITLNVYSDFDKSSLKDANLKPFELLTDITDRNYKYANAEITNNLSVEEYFKFIGRLNTNTKVIKVNPNFTNEKGQKLGLSNYLYVKLKSEKDYNLLKSKAAELHIDIIEQNKFMPLWFTLKITKRTSGSTLEAANTLFETGSFASSQPDFLSDDLLCTNDPMFGSLWGLNNSANTNLDINACSAWTLAEGAGVNVAVLDQGIFKTHIDLSTNIHPLSYNTETNSSPSQIFGDHGTHCAGTIAAIKDNNTQVVGVAPKAKLMDVSNSLAGTANSRIKRADGINWAWQNGADIISNSWGSSVQYQVINDAIANALLNGRGGKGTIIVFASGNDNSGVSYPANINPDILAIGAMTSSGNRSSFSNYGSQLDVIAPGSGILSTVLNNGTGTKDGTSMATPHVAGVAALILSANPCLTAKQVRDIIEQTAQKVRTDLYSYVTTSGKPNGTWNNQMGYGLVDAYAAVLKAKNMYSLAAFDSASDVGLEPNPSATTWANIYQSPDVWNRRTNSALLNLTHQDPGYGGPGSNVMRFRVHNIGCTTSAPSFARLYWTMGSTGETWPNSWNGVQLINGFSAGGELTVPYTGFNSSNAYATGQGFKIPALAPGQTYIIDAKWTPVDPTIYGGLTDNVLCFLGRIVTPGDPMYNENPGPGAPIEPNVTNNNNVVTRNTKLVNLSGTFFKKTGFFFGNYLEFDQPYDIRFNLIKDSNIPFKNIGRVVIKLNDIAWQRWEEGGKLLEGLQVYNYNEHEFLVIDPLKAAIKNVNVKVNEYFPIALTFQQENTSITSPEDYDFAVSQTVTNNPDQLYGSVCHFLVSINQKDVDEGEPFCDEKCRAAKAQSMVLQDIKLSPNPASSNATLEFNLIQDAKVNIILADYNGTTLKTISNAETMRKGISRKTFSISDLPNGVYVVSILANNEKKSVHLIVKH